MKDSCFDIGNTTRTALHAFEQSGRPDAPTGPFTAGNGSLMRLAPVPLFYARNMADAVHFSGQSSITTHAAPNAIDACRYYAPLIVAAIEGQDKADLLADRPARRLTPASEKTHSWRDSDSPLEPGVAATGRVPIGVATPKVAT